MNVKGEVTWLVLCIPGLKHVPKWRRSFVMDEAGTIYLPAGLICDEQRDMRHLTEDRRVPFFKRKGHVYVPAWWLVCEEPELPEIVELWQLVENEFKRYITGNGQGAKS
jgi:hypothetical protein